MSRVHLIAADKPLPLCDRQEERTSTHTVSGTSFTISCMQGFRVAEHNYYRHAVNVLGYSIKPFQYELELEFCEEDLSHLKEYLSRNFHPGETVELWSIWVGIDQSGGLPHYSGNLKDFDMETMEQFLNPDPANNAPGQCWITITI